MKGGGGMGKGEGEEGDGRGEEKAAVVVMSFFFHLFSLFPPFLDLRATGVCFA